MNYQCIYADPPWQQQMAGKYSKTRNKRPARLPYPAMTVAEIKALPVASWCAPDAHCWLWTTASFLRAGFDVLDAWGFKYLNNVTWVKPSGCGNWFSNRTQVCLFGYRGKLRMQQRYLPNVIFAPAKRHSQKPPAMYEMIEQVSGGPYLELFARNTRDGWRSVGNAIDGQDIRNTNVKETDERIAPV